MRKWLIVLIVIAVIGALAAATYFSSRNKKTSIQPQIESLKATEIKQIQSDFERLLAPLPEALAYEKFKADIERLYSPEQIPEDIKTKLAELKETKILAELKLYYGSETKAQEELEKMKQSGEYAKI